MEDTSHIREFYRSTKILITGGTGFMGKILIDKLLRTCPEIDHLYLVIRTKKGKECETRLKELFDDPVFNRLKKEYPAYRDKVTCIAGDCGMENLGISEQDRKLLSSTVTNVFHGAATVRFDEKIKLAVNINVRGVKEMLKFCKTCRNLKSVVHISTAYANCQRKEISEQFYEPPITGDSVISLVSALDDSKLEKITPHIIGEWPNTYAFTKAIAENVILEYGKGLPIAVFRPAIVIGTHQDPVPGWIDNVYGPTGVVVGVAAGLLRTLYADADIKADLVPVDLAVNALICSAWEIANRYNNNTITDGIEETFKKEIPNNEPPSVPVYNFVSSKENPLLWGDFLKLNMKHGRKVPTIRSIWFYTLTMTKVRFWYEVMAILFHLIPALVMDGGLLLAGKKPLMWNAYKKIHKFSNVIAYFSTKEWNFCDTNVKNLWSMLSEVDKKIYNFDMNSINWDQFFKNNVWGIRVYLFRDESHTLKAARRKMLLFHIGHRIFQLIVATLILWILYKILSVMMYSSTDVMQSQSFLVSRWSSRKLIY